MPDGTKIMKTLTSLPNPTVTEALEYAEDLPADCFADRCIIELAAEVVRLREGIKKCLKENAHLADGKDCTLAGLKRLIDQP